MGPPAHPHLLRMNGGCRCLLPATAEAFLGADGLGDRILVARSWASVGGGGGGGGKGAPTLAF